ncbi:MAG: hypothetical protein KJZ69_18490 [Phycisphaerales bacterium]|nr:hypothetical protein [Phycisphaerales bacterium]
MKKSILFAAGVMGLGAVALGQTGTLDQQSPMTNAWYNIGASSLTWQQQVRCGIAGQLEGFQLTIAGNPGAQFNVRVRVGDGWNTGAIVFQNLFTKPGSGNEIMFIDVTSANINLNAGDTFVIETQGNDTGAGLIGNYDPANPGYPEWLFLNGPGCYSNCGWRHGFNTYMLQGSRFTIRLSGSCPGQKTLSWSGAGSGQMGIILGNGPGNYTIPGGPCQGTQLGLSGPGGLQLYNIIGTNGGQGQVTANVGTAACGKWVQCIKTNDCTTSNATGPI